MPPRREFLLLLFTLPCLLRAQEIKYIDLTAVRPRNELRHPPAPKSDCKEDTGCIGGGYGGGSVGDGAPDQRDPHALGIYLLRVTPTDINPAEPFKVEGPAADVAKSDMAKPDALKDEAPKDGAPKNDAPKIDPVKADPAKAEPVATDPVRIEPVKAEPRRGPRELLIMSPREGSWKRAEGTFESRNAEPKPEKEAPPARNGGRRFAAMAAMLVLAVIGLIGLGIDEMLVAVKDHPELRAPIADVVITNHPVANEAERAVERVADDGRADMADVHRLGHIG